MSAPLLADAARRHRAHRLSRHGCSSAPPACRSWSSAGRRRLRSCSMAGGRASPASPPDETQAVFLSGLRGPAAQLGLRRGRPSAQLKLLAALPAGGQTDPAPPSARAFTSTRSAGTRPPPASTTCATSPRAVWDDQELRIRYESWKARAVERPIEPLGLVLKAGEWYLVARVARDLRTFKLAAIQDARAPDRAVRPAAPLRPRRLLGRGDSALRGKRLSRRGDAARLASRIGPAAPPRPARRRRGRPLRRGAATRAAGAG